jgi:hypothetical protein
MKKVGLKKERMLHPLDAGACKVASAAQHALPLTSKPLSKPCLLARCGGMAARGEGKRGVVRGATPGTIARWKRLWPAFAAWRRPGGGWCGPNSTLHSLLAHMSRHERNEMAMPTQCAGPRSQNRLSVRPGSHAATLDSATNRRHARLHSPISPSFAPLYPSGSGRRPGCCPL